MSELLLFHPVDTVAKRLMSNQTVAVKGQPVAEATAALNKVSSVFVFVPVGLRHSARARRILVQSARVFCVMLSCTNFIEAIGAKD